MDKKWSHLGARVSSVKLAATSRRNILAELLVPEFEISVVLKRKFIVFS